MFLFDPASIYANEADRLFLHGNKYCSLSSSQTETIRTLWKKNRGSMEKTDRSVLECLGLSENIERKMDSRIAEVLNILREAEEVPENAVDFLCARVFLSKSRLSHLFKENLGISLSRYLSWEKMRKGFIYFQKYSNITQAAMRAGFNSPSHFAATCRRMFGLSFSDYTKS